MESSSSNETSIFSNFPIFFDKNAGSSGQKTRLVCVPSFAKTQSVAVVNLRTLDCRQLSFRLNGFEDIEE